MEMFGCFEILFALFQCTNHDLRIKLCYYKIIVTKVILGKWLRHCYKRNGNWIFLNILIWWFSVIIAFKQFYTSHDLNK